MARPRKKTASSHPAPAESETPIPSDNLPDIFDQAIADQQPPQEEPNPSQEPSSSKLTAKITRPDPFGEVTIALSESKDGPKTRLYRNQRFQQLAIQYDEKPHEGIRQKLREDGWTWRGKEGAWTKQLGDRPGVTHRAAEELFVSIANDLRQANGLTPVSTLSQGR